MKVTITIPEVDAVVNKLEIGKYGRAQLFHTQNVLRRMVKYMPKETGIFEKQAIISSPHTIQIIAPQAWYLYYGNRMVNSKTGKGPRYIPNVGWRWPRYAKLIATSQPLKYTKTFHPLAGAYWDRRLLAAESDIIAQELKDYIKTL